MADIASFLKRWSRRKLGEPRSAGVKNAEGGARIHAAEVAQGSLGPDTDYAQFLGDDVPSELRAQALRRLWEAESRLAEPDDLIDYRGDYTEQPADFEAEQLAFHPHRGHLSEEEAKEWAELGRDERDSNA